MGYGFSQYGRGYEWKFSSDFRYQKFRCGDSAPNSASANGCTTSCVNTGPGDINITSATGEMRISTDSRAVQIFYTNTGTVKYQYHQYCVLPTGGAVEATSDPGPSEGNPISNFFDLSKEINEDNLDEPYIKIYAKLTLIK